MEESSLRGSLSDECVFQVECKLYSRSKILDKDESQLASEQYLGSVSLTSETVDLSDEQIVRLLDVAHIENALAMEIVPMVFSASELAGIGLEAGDELFVQDVWMSGYVTEACVDFVEEECDTRPDIRRGLEQVADEVDIVKE